MAEATTGERRRNPRDRRMIGLAPAVHDRLRTLSRAEGYKISKLAERLIREGLDRMPTALN